MAKAASRASRSYMASLLYGILVAWLTSTTMATIQGQKTQGFYAVSITQEAQQCASRVQAVVEGCGVSDSAVCLLYTSPSPRDSVVSRMPSSA